MANFISLRQIITDLVFCIVFVKTFFAQNFALQEKQLNSRGKTAMTQTTHDLSREIIGSCIKT
jgi:hypothetical protein